uniref:14-3-3 domain-containing protein n=1 Tax=Arcella intermedia TaxID=1963864 RepID=A0A6B2LFA5_9EUKA
MMAKDDHVYVAKLAEQAERYQDMVHAMKLVAQENKELTAEERNLLYVSYKNATYTRRQSWRVLKSIEEQAAKESLPKYFIMIRNYREKIEKELSGLCNEVIQILKENCIPHCTFKESIVFYHKMEGDYWRYLTEFKLGKEKEHAIEGALEAYSKGSKIASELPPTHPIRLGLALNFSVFYFDSKGDVENATKIALEAYNSSNKVIKKEANEDTYKDTAIILHLLKENLNMWSPGLCVDDGEDSEDLE